MTTPFAEWLRAAKKRCERATPGKWEFERTSFDSGDFVYERNDKHAMVQIYERDYTSPMKAKFDSEFIAHARQDLPRALQLLEESINLLRIVTKESASKYGIAFTPAMEFLARLERE